MTINSDLTCTKFDFVVAAGFCVIGAVFLYKIKKIHDYGLKKFKEESHFQPECPGKQTQMINLLKTMGLKNCIIYGSGLILTHK
jgi:hypothetical protein